MDMPTEIAGTDRIASLSIDDTELPAPTPEAEQERNIAVFDLLESNRFRLLAPNAPRGPYNVQLAARERRLVFEITGSDGARSEIALPFSVLRKQAREYFAVCDSYFEAVRSKSRNEIATLDEGRKALHNDGADDLTERLSETVEIDSNTARRLFTLVCSLVYRG